MNKYASVRPFWIATADALLFENVHYTANCSEVLDLTLCMLHSLILQFTYSWNVTVLLQCQHTLS